MLFFHSSSKVPLFVFHDLPPQFVCCSFMARQGNNYQSRGENGKNELRQKYAKEAPLPFAHHSHVISHFHFDESANFDTFQHVVTVSVG